MDKRFFLALFLSLVVIAISQLLFPSAKPIPGSRGVIAKDSSAELKEANSSTASSIEKSAGPLSTPRLAPAASGTTTRVVAETATVTTLKAIYKFSNIGAAPVSIVIRDYANRSASGGLVDLAISNSPLLGYRLVTATDTADLSRIPFALSRARDAMGNEI